MQRTEKTCLLYTSENILENLDSLYWDLRNATYTPGEYRIKVIYEPKERVIMIAPVSYTHLNSQCYLVIF